MDDTEKLDALLTQVGEVKRELTAVSMRLASMAEKQHEHSTTLYGNGRPGNCERIGDIEHGIETIEARCKRREGLRTPWKDFFFRVGVNLTTLILSAIVVSLFGLVLAAKVAEAMARMSSS